MCNECYCVFDFVEAAGCGARNHRYAHLVASAIRIQFKLFTNLSWFSFFAFFSNFVDVRLSPANMAMDIFRGKTHHVCEDDPHWSTTCETAGIFKSKFRLG